MIVFTDMLKKLRFTFLFLIAGCIEPYEFVVRNPEPSLVVEAFISDTSFNETLTYPPDGRYFTVRLTLTGDVQNTRPLPVSGAVVTLVTSEGDELIYTETGSGIYTLTDPAFEAQSGVLYSLRIATPDENVYESSWEGLPDVDVPAMGDISFVETELQQYVMEYPKWVLRSKQVALVNVEVPPNTTGEEIYYRWTYSPMWIYVAPLISQNDPVYRCWATDRNYLPTYGLQADRAGGYRKDLFSFPTIRNERIFEKFSVLVTQHAMTEPHYSYWKELKDQGEGGMLTDVPPYNLRTNFTSAADEKRVSGYFGVTSEQAKRWYFDRTDLSYYVENTLKADCLVVYGPGPPAEECTNCTAYSFGTATTTKPAWWMD